MPTPVIYDPRYMEWDQWSSLMVEAFGAQQLEISSGESEWKSWAVGFRGIDLFSKDAVPDPYQFDRWQDWATAVINVVTDKP